MAESKVLTACLRYLGARSDCRVWRNNSGKLPRADGGFVSFGLVGSADILGLRLPAGQFVAIECKSPTGRTTKQQDAFARMVRAFGGLYIVARSVEDLYSEFPPS